MKTVDEFLLDVCDGDLNSDRAQQIQSDLAALIAQARRGALVEVVRLLANADPRSTLRGVAFEISALAAKAGGE